MSRIVSAGMLSFLWLTSSQSFGQTRDRRLDEAVVDITLLKRLVMEQDRRIADLEKLVKALQAGQATASPKPEERLIAPVRPSFARWKNPLTWNDVREGLSRAQVEEILGPPSSVESVIDYQTLTYKGDVPGSGTVSGTVKLTDDRVSQVNPPDF